MATLGRARPNRPSFQPTGRPKHGPKRRPKHRGGGGAEDLGASKPYAEADITQTSLLRAQGKAFAFGREAVSGSRIGATGGAGGEEEQPKRKKKGLLKKKSNAKKFSLNSAGQVKKTGRPKRPR